MNDMRLCEKIAKTLFGRGGGLQRVVLAGEAGTGKTWLAKMVSEHATKEGMCYFTLWLHLNKRFDDVMSLYENIAFQLEVYDRDEMEGKQAEDLLTALQEKISAVLRTKKRSLIHTSSAVRVPYLLLILDDEGYKTSEDTVMKDLGLESFFNKQNLDLKLLITRRQRDENTTRSEIEFHATDESHAILETLTHQNLQDLFESLIKDEARGLFESLERAWKMDEPLIPHVLQKSNNLPAAIAMLSKSLKCITHQKNFKTLSPKQEKVLKEILFPSALALSDYGSKSTVESYRYNPILHLAYQLLETDDTLKNAIVDCFWHSLDLFKHCGCINYNELITQWILEGYFDPVRSVKKAYKDGHDILLELIKRGMLKIQEGDFVVPEVAMNQLTDLRHHGFLGRSRLRFATVYGGDKNKSLGKVTQIDDMIKAVQANKRENILTILVSGNRLRRETPKEYFEQPQMKDLEILGLFSPTMEYLIRSLRELRKLRVLVIRDYDLLQSMEDLKDLRRLEVLEVSGASSVETISDDFFAAMSELQSLNLSGLRIKSSPSSISQLKYLHSLILRDCLVLENLPDMQYLDRLEVLDVRGACKLRTCFGMKGKTSRNRTFSRLQQLQLLDFSESKLKRLPIFHNPAAAANLHSLTRLSLRKCSNLVKLPNLRPLSGLQILDLSCGTSLVEVAAVCFEQKEELKMLNFSGTKLTKLPSTISGLYSLRQLLLRDNSSLEALPNIKGLISLEVFDVSGCTSLHKIEGSFEEMSYLREVNLSGTRIETLPELPVKHSLCCPKLVVLADSRSLIRDNWSQVKEAITKEISESLSSPGTVNRIREISKRESGRLREKQLHEAWAFDGPATKGDHREHFYKGRIYKLIYMNAVPFFDTESHQKVLEIQGSHGIDQDKETLAKAEFVAFVDKSTESLSSIFNDLKSVRSCWLEMCGDIHKLFSGVDEERLRNLETMSIKNFRLMDSICSSSFKNLKKLSLDCCPSIKTLFPAFEPPTSLEVLKIKFCDKLEKVFEKQVEVRNLHTLCLLELPMLSVIGATLPNLEIYKKDKCPKLNTSEENLISRVSPMLCLSLVCSLFVIFCSSRKRTSNKFLILFVWSSYLLADLSANFAVSLIAKNQGKAPKPDDPPQNKKLLALWAPFLLLHLGGPDTITAFSLEDNALWNRHFLGLVFQALAGVYVVVQSLPNVLWVMILLLFISGTSKYLERTIALYLASSDKFRGSMLQASNLGFENNEQTKNLDTDSIIASEMYMKENRGQPKPLKLMFPDRGLTHLEILQYAFLFFNNFKSLMVNNIFSSELRDESKAFFSSLHDGEALRIIEVELDFIYEGLYTKGAVLHSWLGLVSRLISLGSLLSALGIFHYRHNKIKEFQKGDIVITYTLFLVGIALDFISIQVFMVSDWTTAILAKLKDDPDEMYSRKDSILNWMFSLKSPKWKRQTCRAGHQQEALKRPFLLRRWNESINMLNFITYSMNADTEKIHNPTDRTCRHLWKTCVFPFRENQVARFVIATFKTLVEFWYHVPYFFAFLGTRFINFLGIKDLLHEIRLNLYSLENTKTKSTARRGWASSDTQIQIADSEMLLHYIRDVDYDHSLLIWHIATELCYQEEASTNENCDKYEYHTDREISKILSDYMMYLLSMQPKLMSEVAGIGKIRFRDTLAEAERFYKKMGIINSRSVKLASEKILSVDTSIEPRDVKGNHSKSVLFEATSVAKELMKLEKDFGKDKWKTLSKVWLEFLFHAASHCDGTTRLELLSKGGEFINFVWLLMAHFGLGD
ncbi:P-loop containing nucleoside triphosphate hydrolase [Arabidopsis thaliana x Arabidopsis arenosa]|uniref:P-loop containing nucleoside triphosphate hydrolase n=1 Tax=Arabidopsis thaliana x Arabidopsis arenosa TaxID=1240361 RepID=A0A8T1Y7R6_9BRAS|nr:P-loop containing nucleoside triphosphate hydrolase [Arabidopsis thaliana x Arabidopsis arenosa]